MTPTTMLMFYASGGSGPQDLRDFLAQNEGTAMFQKLMKRLDREQNFAYSTIGGFASYIADSLDGFIIIRSTRENFPTIITSGPGREYDASTRDKLRNGDSTHIIDWSTFLAPSTLPNETSIMGKMYAYSWTLDRLSDVCNLNSKGSISDTIVPLSVPFDGKDSMMNVKIPKASEKAMYYDPRNGSFYNQNFNPHMIEKRDSIMKSKK